MLGPGSPVRTRVVQSALICAILLVLPRSSAGADGPAIELGTSLVHLSAGLGDRDGTTLGIPSTTGYGYGGPGVFVSIFVSPTLSVEPQLQLVRTSSGGRSAHLFTLGGQLNYFVDGTSRPSAYLFGVLGVSDTSGGGNPANIGAGVGYRVPIGGRLTFRLDARVEHLTDDAGNRVGMGISIGGLFGER